METSSFDEQIFNDFASPLSPIGAKQIIHSGHSVQGMLSMNATGTQEFSNQRLPEVQSLLPGSPKLNHYKPIDYMVNKIDYSPKIGAYSSTPPPKYDYSNGKIDQYPSNHMNKIEYAKPMDYNLNTKMDYVNGKMDYDPHMHMYQQQSIVGPTAAAAHQITTSQTLDPAQMNDKKKSDNHCDQSDNQSVSQSDASSTSKKNDKKKGDINGVKKKKTRYSTNAISNIFFSSFFINAPQGKREWD